MTESQNVSKDVLILQGLDHLDQGISIFDRDLLLVACNRRYLDLLGFPHDMGRPGTPAEVFFRHNALRGEYGPGDIEDLVRERMDLAREFQAHHIQRERPNGTTLDIRGVQLPGGGWIDRKSVVKGKSVSERVDLGGRRDRKT